MASIEILIIAAVIALFLQFVDSSAGMGFGTMTPILLLMGFAPLEVVPAVIFGSAILSLVAGGLHHAFKNMDLSPGTKDFKISTVFILFGLVGVFIGVFAAVGIPKLWLDLYIALLILAIGVSMIFLKAKGKKFSWKRIVGLGLFASFNKGISGGGYGPTLAGGQMISGVSSRKAVSLTAISEGAVSTFGFMMYILLAGTQNLNWPLMAALVIGGLISSPFSTYMVSKIKVPYLKKFVGVVGILLGLALLVKIVFFPETL